MKRGPYKRWLAKEAPVPKSTKYSTTKDFQEKVVSSKPDLYDKLDEDDDWSILKTFECKDTPIYENANITTSDSVMLLMDFMLSNNLSGTVVDHLLKILRLHLPKEANPSHLRSLYFLKKYFGLMNRTNGDFKIHDICSKCLDLFRDESQTCQNPHCDANKRYMNEIGGREKKPREFFLEFDISHQIQEFFKGMYKHPPTPDYGPIKVTSTGSKL
ncbi:unnamed protein product [Owenia fusiformis]|uniref:Uncharacterized protein n=1 Tax=Owenia fusiformis TaxID=6347 RepID=A0A8J1UE32_OWEFU|nr:unnamed protein product [Owenia fusiformis]